MTEDFLRRVLAFVLFTLVQALVLNHIHLLGYATPLLYVDFVITFRRNYPRWAILVWCFALGLCVDVFSNTPGVAAGSMTLLGCIQPYILEPFIPRDSTDDMQPTMKTLGAGKFFFYMLICVMVYTLVFFALEVFNFFNWQQWLLSVGGSIAITALLIFVIENLWRK